MAPFDDKDKLRKEAEEETRLAKERERIQEERRRRQTQDRLTRELEEARRGLEREKRTVTSLTEELKALEDALEREKQTSTTHPATVAGAAQDAKKLEQEERELFELKRKEQDTTHRLGVLERELPKLSDKKESVGVRGQREEEELASLQKTESALLRDEKETRDAVTRLTRELAEKERHLRDVEEKLNDAREKERTHTEALRHTEGERGVEEDVAAKKAEVEKLKRETGTMEEMKKRLEQDIAEIKKKVEEQEAGERGAREEAARTSDTYHLHIRQKQERERKLTTAKSAVVRLSEQVAQLEREIRGLRQGVEHGT